MIPTIELDQESFQEIFERSRKRIPALYPTWTNFNTNDSGIAMLELLSWLRQVQDFHMNQIGEEHLLMYLKLMGMKMKSISPGHAIVHCSKVKREEILPKGYVFLAGDITFQSEEAVRLYSGQLRKLTAIDEDGVVLNERQMEETEQKMQFPIFGRNPKVGNFMEMVFDRPFLSGEVFGFYFSIYDDYAMKRNPVSETFLPLTKISVEYKTAAGWQACRIVKDDTFGLIKNGILRIQIPFFQEQPTEETYSLRIRLDWGEYDVIPFLEYLNLNPIQLVQCETVAEYGTNLKGKADFLYQKTEHGYKEIRRIDNAENDILYCRVLEGYGTGILGYGTGFPNQSVPLGFSGVLEESVKILVENPEYPNVFELWERVEDFGGSSPEGRHFMVDEVNHVICFGDNVHGLAPEGEIRLLSAMRTEGAAGNVKRRQIHAGPLLDEEEPFFIATNEEDVLDGTDRETIEECFERFRKEVRETDYAATEEDFEYHILTTPGLMIEKVKIVEVDSEKNTIYAAVKPWSQKDCPKLSRMYYNNIMRHMDTRRLIGTDFCVMEPEYIQITLYMDLELRTHIYDVDAQMKERLNVYFNHVQSDFGEPILYSTLYGFLDAMQDVAKVHALTIDASGQGIERNISGDVILPPNGLASLGRVLCSVSYSK